MQDETKVWGLTRTLEINPFVSIHRAAIKQGYRCSKHKHHYRWNGFYVEKGYLNVRYWDEGGEHLHTIGPGSFFKVPPQVYHQFETPYSECTVIEIYWLENLGPDDIDRENEGGLLNE